ncbi:hypothetical protein RTCIAT899_PA00410 (plasmid) [Rhizobium tropici CIAT 899]|uniref:Membrane protein n=1 Tax=Rhizobium tropici TaxID=398 RepID=A0ABR6R3W1_RHITR|nr:hypothetical protein RTCIAT899_PA00410 [Rhizobium tropici CIAT 899]MBB4243687.1 putative membrane protein [Rhizobium tropici]MBB5595864.1 putative membrane protein [Rhizobium tropici]MBB6493856.1 putative membrane protein [Rhizobium tropici]
MENVVKTYVVAYIVTLVVFIAIDFIWLSSMTDRLYRPVMAEILTADFRLAPAIAFYLIYAFGLTVLAVRPGLIGESIQTAIVCGAMLGFTAYATYDLTNQATLKNWSTILTLADLFWGTILSGFAAGCGQWITARLLGTLTHG